MMCVYEYIYKTINTCTQNVEVIKVRKTETQQKFELKKKIVEMSKQNKKLLVGHHGKENLSFTDD